MIKKLTDKSKALYQSLVKQLRSAAIAVGLGLARWGGWKRVGAAVPMDAALLSLAVILVQRQDANWPERDGECKRANVYAQLVNTFPNLDKRMISRAIEESLCGDY